MESKQYDGYLFSIIIRGCFLNGNISEVHIYKEQTSRMDRAIFVWPWNENARTKQKQQTNVNRAVWLLHRTDTNARDFWLVKRTLGWKNFMPVNFLKINRYFVLTSNCNTIGQSNNVFSILEFSLAGKQRGHVLIFSSISSFKFLKPLQRSRPGKGICDYCWLNQLFYFFTSGRVKDTCIIYWVQGESRVRKSCKPFSVEPGTHWSILRSKWSAFRDNLQRQMGSV